ncbi:hypothetical protein [Rubrivirga sp.]|uniref:hypothetical protein n=1 Tax=Rubrivirga sp. TaxID=1885344 RepID=UPI003B524429
MRLALLAVVLLVAPAHAQFVVTGDVSAGPSLTTLGASGTVEAAGVPIPLGRVDVPASVGIDARARVEVHGSTWGGRVGVGYLSASDVFDGASLFRQRGVDLAFAVASAEVTARRAYRSGAVVAGVGPELRVVLDEGTEAEGLLAVLGDVRQSHVAVGGSVGGRWVVGGLVLGPEVRGGLSLTPFSDDRVEAFGGVVRLAGDFRFDHVSVGLTLAVE